MPTQLEYQMRCALEVASGTTLHCGRPIGTARPILRAGRDAPFWVEKRIIAVEERIISLRAKHKLLPVR